MHEFKKRSMRSVQVRSFFWSVFSRIGTKYEDLRSPVGIKDLFGPNKGKYGPEKSLYLDIFHTVKEFVNNFRDICEFFNSNYFLLANI